jgi:hypothetical protein
MSLLVEWLHVLKELVSAIGLEVDASNFDLEIFGGGVLRPFHRTRGE